MTPHRGPDGGETWTARSWKPTGRFLYGFFVRGTYYVHHQGVGLQRMVNDELQTIAGSEPFAEERAQVLLPYGDTDLLLGTFNHGLFRYDGRTFVPFTTA